MTYNSLPACISTHFAQADNGVFTPSI